MPEPLISSERVSEMLRDSLYTSDELIGVPEEGAPVAPNGSIVPTEAVIAEAVMNRYGFNPERLESHRSEVTEMLQNLPLQFRQADVGGGGGWSFLNACQDANDVQWTGMHQVMDELFALGIALGLANWLMPRDMWSALPGGMPYVGVLV